MKSFAALFLGLAVWLQGQEPVLTPDSLVQPGVPRGTLTWHTLAPGNFYPGTPHRYAVYRPARLPVGQAASYMIFLDGTGAIQGMHVPVVLDNLIARGDLPPLVGIFVDPGILPVLSPEQQNRYERIFEYDSLSDRFVSFLLEELVPAVAQEQLLSDRADDHAIAGVSTGAVGAFVAAWQRPNQFHRLLSLIGTYVDMKGAEELPSLVRKTEPRPLRVFMQDGRNDHIVPGQPWGISFAGSWPINNQVMFEALKFAGYDARLVMGEGLHNTRQGAVLMPEALRWLWGGYPRPIAVREPATMTQPGYEPRGRVYSLVSADRPWEQIGGTYSSIGGLAANAEGELFFTEPLASRLYRVDVGGRVSLVRDDVGGAAALGFGPAGRLYAAQPLAHRIVSFGPAGEMRVEAERVEAATLTVTARGEVYFLDRLTGGIGRISPRGELRRGQKPPEMILPSGLALSPDQGLLVVADGQSRFSWSYQLGPDRTPENGEPFYRLYVPDLAPASGVTAVTLDTLGQVFFASPLGIQVAEQNGRIAAILNGPDFGRVSSLAFGGQGQSWLYAVQAHKLFRRKTKVTGAGATPVKPPQPAL